MITGRPQVTSLVGALVTVAVALLAAAAVATTARATALAMHTAFAAAELARIDALLIRAAGRISHAADEAPPTWRREVDGLEIGSLDGERTHSIAVTRHPAGGVRVRIASTHHHFPRLSLEDARVLGEPFPQLAVVLEAGGRMVRICAPLAGVVPGSRP